MKLHQMQERRATTVAEIRGLTDKADIERRDLTADEDTKFAPSRLEIADLDKHIARALALTEFARSAPAIVHGRVGDEHFEERARDVSIVKAIRSTLPIHEFIEMMTAHCLLTAAVCSRSRIGRGR